MESEASAQQVDSKASAQQSSREGFVPIKSSDLYDPLLVLLIDKLHLFTGRYFLKEPEKRGEGIRREQ